MNCSEGDCPLNAVTTGLDGKCYCAKHDPVHAGEGAAARAGAPKLADPSDSSTEKQIRSGLLRVAYNAVSLANLHMNMEVTTATQVRLTGKTHHLKSAKRATRIADVAMAILSAMPTPKKED